MKTEKSRDPQGLLALLKKMIVKPSAVRIKQKPRVTTVMEVLHVTLRRL